MKVEQQQKMDPRWEKILEKRRQRLAILDSGATSGAAGEDRVWINRYRPTIEKNVHVPKQRDAKSYKIDEAQT
jgi:hypothetical protein